MPIPIKRIALVVADSLLRAALVVVLVYGLAWGLMQWAKHQPTVSADDAGVIRLLAADATLHGAPEIRFNIFRGVKNIGWWDQDTQWLTWRLDVEQGGSYLAELRYAPVGAGPVQLALTIGDASVTGAIHAGGGADPWQTIPLGTIALAAGDDQSAALKVVDLPSPGVVNFVWIELKPVE